MYSKLFKTVCVAGVVAVLAGCVTANKKAPALDLTNSASILDRETFYASTGNTRALVQLYRTILQHKEDSAVRFKLSQAYYNLGDYKASLLYLKPLLTAGEKTAVNVRLLEVDNLIRLGKNNEALVAVNRLLTQYPKNAQAYNQKGIINAQLGNYKPARASFTKARALFIDDTTALNNLAMLDILELKYKDAVQALLPVYMNGNRDTRLMHNLVYALIKRDEIDTAKNIMINNNLEKPDNVDSVIEMLRKLSPKKTPEAFKHAR